MIKNCRKKTRKDIHAAVMLLELLLGNRSSLGCTLFLMGNSAKRDCLNVGSFFFVPFFFFLQKPPAFFVPFQSCYVNFSGNCNFFTYFKHSSRDYSSGGFTRGIEFLFFNNLSTLSSFFNIEQQLELGINGRN